MAVKGIIVTDHALVRYLERVKGMDTDAIKTEILTPGLVDAVRAGCVKFKSNGSTYVIENNSVITVLD